MRKNTKRKIIKILLLLIISFSLLLSLILYNILGPFRSFFWNLPGIAGFLGPRNYLVLIQNDNELRPTGGFITAVAEVSLFFGYPSVSVSDVYQIPDPQPKITAPEPFSYFIGQNDPFFAGWTLRDANFSPDFAKSSQDIINLYQKAYPENDVDGVFSVDFAVIEKLLEMYGPFDVDGTMFDKENFFINTQRLSKDIDTHNVEQLKNRKNILKPFAQTLFKTIMKSPGKYGLLSSTLAELAREKHVQAYSSSESLQQKFCDQDLCGKLSVPASGSDFLHVNVANIGGRKADRYVTKEIKYLADFSNPEQQVSRLTVTLEHLGSYNIQSDIYQAYVRSYVPLGSRLLHSSGTNLRLTESTTDLGATVFADYIRLKPGESITLSYEYELPKEINPQDYRLFIDKQAGLQNDLWQIAVKQVNDSSMKNGDPQEPPLTPMQLRENLAFWQGEVHEKRAFHLLQSADKQAPIILWQKFTDLNTINIRFNELLDIGPVLEKMNYELRDLNEKNTVTDELKIISARFEDRDLWLTVEGLTDQPEEHYEITLKNLADINGNVIEPNPLTRTLVQRFE